MAGHIGKDVSLEVSFEVSKRSMLFSANSLVYVDQDVGSELLLHHHAQLSGTFSPQNGHEPPLKSFFCELSQLWGFATAIEK